MASGTVGTTDRPTDVGGTTGATPTTILLSRAGESWRATQRGVDAVGSGETAPRAIVAYCRLVEEGRDVEDGASTTKQSSETNQPSERNQ